MKRIARSIDARSIAVSGATIGRRHWLALLLLVGFMAATMNVAHATPIGFHPDVGDSYFETNGSAVGIEIIDLIEPLAEFGFFFESDALTLIPIFDSSDLGGGQLALINFDTGVIDDLDGDGPTTFFGASTENIGFYLTIDSALTLYSDPTLNVALGGLDLFTAYENIVDPLEWALLFAGDLGNGFLENISFNRLLQISAAVPAAVPLPPTVYLMGSLLPILMLVSRRRRKKLAAV